MLGFDEFFLKKTFFVEIFDLIPADWTLWGISVIKITRIIKSQVFLCQHIVFHDFILKKFQKKHVKLQHQSRAELTKLLWSHGSYIRNLLKNWGCKCTYANQARDDACWGFFNQLNFWKKITNSACLLQNISNTYKFTTYATKNQFNFKFRSRSEEVTVISFLSTAVVFSPGIWILQNQ